MGDNSFLNGKVVDQGFSSLVTSEPGVGTHLASPPNNPLPSAIPASLPAGPFQHLCLCLGRSKPNLGLETTPCIAYQSTKFGHGCLGMTLLKTPHGEELQNLRPS